MSQLTPSQDISKVSVSEVLPAPSTNVDSIPVNPASVS